MCIVKTNVLMLFVGKEYVFIIHTFCENKMQLI